MRQQWQQVWQGLVRRGSVAPLAQSLPALEQWLSTPLGQQLLAQEREILQQQLPTLFGYHLLQLSISRQVDLTQASKIRHRFALTPGSWPEQPPSLLTGRADLQALPLPDESLDVVLLHHVLEFAPKPHALLREAARVVIPHGHVVLVLFNPWSLFGAWKWLGRGLTGRTQWRHHALRISRLEDWLRLLDFEPVHICQGFYRPPLRGERGLERLLGLEQLGQRLRLPWGGVTLIVARKEVAAVTPLKPRQGRKISPLLGLGSLEPSPRASARG